MKAFKDANLNSIIEIQTKSEFVPKDLYGYSNLGNRLEKFYKNHS